MIILGIDPSLNNFGFAFGEYYIESNTYDIKHIGLSESPPSTDKRIRKNSDDLERIRNHRDCLAPFVKQADVVFVEIPVGSQSARAMASYGLCVGYLSCILQPLIQVMPSEVKLAACGKKTASKKDMITWATHKFPDLDWFRGKGGFGNKNEHIADSIGAIAAGIKTDDFNGLVTMAKLYDKS